MRSLPGDTPWSLMPTFDPPLNYLDSQWRYTRSKHRLFSFYTFPRAMSVLLRNGSFIQLAEPYIGEVEALVEGETYFQGGRSYEVSDATAAALEAAGFTVNGEVEEPDEELGFGDAGYGEGGYGL